MDPKTDIAKTKAQEILNRIKNNQSSNQTGELEPKTSFTFKPNARMGTINRSRR